MDALTEWLPTPGLPSWLPRHRTEWLAGGLHVVILIIAAQVGSPAFWPYAMAAMAAVSFWAWIGNFSRHRQIRDLPTSRIASAPQGYVGLFGEATLIPDETVSAPLSHRPCCWYRYRIEDRSGNDWTTSEEGVSTSHFFITDDTGNCFVAPDGAEVLYAHRQTWKNEQSRYTEWLILPRSVVYALGEFRTVSGTVPTAERNRAVSAVLADWKADRRSLLQRFDADGDGQIDLAEWEAARQAAGAHVDARHAASTAHGAEHVLCKPADGRVFLLAAAPPHRLRRRFAVWSALHLATFMAAVTGSYLLFASA